MLPLHADPSAAAHGSLRRRMPAPIEGRREGREAATGGRSREGGRRGHGRRRDRGGRGSDGRDKE